MPRRSVFTIQLTIQLFTTSIFTAFTLPALAQSGILQEKLQDFDYWSDRCNLQSDAGKYPEAQAACESAIVLKPKSAITWAEHSHILLKLKQYPESIVSADRALKLDSKNSLAMTYKCMALAGLKKPEDALDACTEALRLDGNWGRRSPALAWRYRGLILAMSGDYDKAVLAYDRTLLLEPKDSTTLTERCGALVQLDRAAEALNDCQAALSANQQWDNLNPAMAWSHQGAAHRQLKQLPKAIAAYDKALQLDPNNADTWAQQAYVLELLDQPTEALTSYNRSIQLKPTSSIALLGRCTMLNKLQQFKDALAACDLAIQGDGTWRELGAVQAWDQRSVALVGTGQLEEALAAANRATGMNSSFAEAWNHRSVALWYLGKYEEALQSVNQAIALKADYAQAWFNQGMILRSQGAYQSALASYDQALNLAPKNPNIWTNRSVALWHLKRFPEALQSADQAISLAPKQFRSWYNRAIALTSMSQMQDALLSYDRALEINPQSAEAMTGKGVILAQTKPTADSQTQAVALLQASLKLNANQPIAKVTLDSLLKAIAEAKKPPAKPSTQPIDPKAPNFTLPSAQPTSTAPAKS